MLFRWREDDVVGAGARVVFNPDDVTLPLIPLPSILTQALSMPAFDTSEKSPQLLCSYYYPSSSSMLSSPTRIHVCLVAIVASPIDPVVFSIVVYHADIELHSAALVQILSGLTIYDSGVATEDGVAPHELSAL